MGRPAILPRGVAYDTKEGVLFKVLDRQTSLVVWERTESSLATKDIEKIEWSGFVGFEFDVNVDFSYWFVFELEKRFNQWTADNAIVSEWVFKDILSLVSHFFAKTGAENISVKLSTNSSLRLASDTYDGLIQLVVSYGPSLIYWNDGTNQEKNMISAFDVVMMSGKLWPGKKTSSMTFGKVNEFAHDTNSLVMQIEYIN